MSKKALPCLDPEYLLRINGNRLRPTVGLTIRRSYLTRYYKEYSQKSVHLRRMNLTEPPKRASLTEVVRYAICDIWQIVRWSPEDGIMWQ